MKLAEKLSDMIPITAAGFEEASLSASEPKTETMLLRTSDHTSLAPPLDIKYLATCKERQPRYYTWAALSTKALTYRSKSSEGPLPCGHASNDLARSCML